MKKITLVLIVLISIHMETKAQQQTQFTASVKTNTFSKKLYSPGYSVPDKDYDLYLRRSKNQRIVGWATLGGGILLSGIGILIASGNQGSYLDAYGNTVGRDNSTLAATLTIAGALSGIVSIPFMIMASANKHKARAMVKNQPTGFGVPSGVNGNITGISVALTIGK